MVQRVRMQHNKQVMLNQYKMNYKDNRWIKKRSEVFKRDSRTCKACGSKQFIQCHHSYYTYGKQLWEYPLNSLFSLCKKCHSRFHKTTKGSLLVINASNSIKEIRNITLNFIKNSSKINPTKKNKTKYFKPKKVKNTNKPETLIQKRNRVIVPQWKIDEFRKNPQNKFA